MNRASAKNSKSQYKNTMGNTKKKFKFAQKLLNTSKSIEFNPVTWERAETHHQGRNSLENVTPKETGKM